MRQFTCKYCGKTFFAKNQTAKYCSTKCRVYAKRARDKAKAPTDGLKVDYPVPHEATCKNRAVTEAAVASEVASARGMVAFFDVASQRGPVETREACGHIARGFKETLEGVGL